MLPEQTQKGEKEPTFCGVVPSNITVRPSENDQRVTKGEHSIMAAGKRQARRSRQELRNVKIKLGLLAVTISLMTISGCVWSNNRGEQNGVKPEETSPPTVTTTLPTEETAPAGTPVPPVEPVSPETIPPAPTEEPPAESETPVSTENPKGGMTVDDYDYSQPVPDSDLAPEDYFNNAAFIGDSRTDGLLLYSGIKGATGLSYKGLMVSELEDKEVKFTVSGITDTVMGALSKETYGKVYMMLGVNELGWYNDQRFYDTYTQAVQRVKELQPGASVYLQSILPVTKEKSDSHAYFTNEKILVYNELIAQVAEEQEVFYLDVASALMNEEGVLPTESSTDGIHLKKDGYKTWYEYLQNHIVTDTETDIKESEHDETNPTAADGDEPGPADGLRN